MKGKRQKRQGALKESTPSVQSEPCRVSKKGKGKKTDGRETEKNCRDRGHTHTQAHNLISFLVCRWITGELAELRVEGPCWELRGS